MTVETILELAALAVIAYKIGQWSVAWQIYRQLKSQGLDPDQLAASEEDRQSQEEALTIERHQDQYLIYGDSLGFLAQGQTFQEAFARVRDRYPGRSFRIRDYQTTLSEEEAGRMVRAVFDVFGDKK